MPKLLFPMRDLPIAMLTKWTLNRLPKRLTSLTYAQLEYLGIEDVVQQRDPREVGIIVSANRVDRS